MLCKNATKAKTKVISENRTVKPIRIYYRFDRTETVRILLFSGSSLREKCPYLEISGPYSVRMWENMGQKNSKYGQFSRSAYQKAIHHIKVNQ